MRRGENELCACPAPCWLTGVLTEEGPGHRPPQCSLQRGHQNWSKTSETHSSWRAGLPVLTAKAGLLRDDSRCECTGSSPGRRAPGFRGRILQLGDGNSECPSAEHTGQGQAPRSVLCLPGPRVLSWESPAARASGCDAPGTSARRCFTSAAALGRGRFYCHFTEGETEVQRG